MLHVHRKRVDYFSRPRRHDDEEPVQSGLAVTPAQMMELAEKGIPITPQNLGVSYDEGYSDLSFDVPTQYQRGIDIADMWEAQEDVKRKFGKNLRQLKADGKLNPSSERS